VPPGNAKAVVVTRTMHRLTLAASAVALGLLFAGCSGAAAKLPQSTVYVHMNGGNHFLEPVVAVAPGERITFVNQDTGGDHTIVGFSPMKGQPAPNINGHVAAAVANGSTPTYTAHLDHVGTYNYYCSLHAVLVKDFGGTIEPAYRTGVDGYKEAMAGIIVVTTDRALIRDNPATTHEKVVPGYFGG